MVAVETQIAEATLYGILSEVDSLPQLFGFKLQQDSLIQGNPGLVGLVHTLLIPDGQRQMSVVSNVFEKLRLFNTTASSALKMLNIAPFQYIGNRSPALNSIVIKENRQAPHAHLPFRFAQQLDFGKAHA